MRIFKDLKNVKFFGGLRKDDKVIIGRNTDCCNEQILETTIEQIFQSFDGEGGAFPPPAPDITPADLISADENNALGLGKDEKLFVETPEIPDVSDFITEENLQPINDFIEREEGFATAAQGKKADTALQTQLQTNWNQDDNLKPDYVKNKPILGSAAAKNISDFATAAQGTKADTAIQKSEVQPIMDAANNANLAAQTAVIAANGAVIAAQNVTSEAQGANDIAQKSIQDLKDLMNLVGNFVNALMMMNNLLPTDNHSINLTPFVGKSCIITNVSGTVIYQGEITTGNATAFAFLDGKNSILIKDIISVDANLIKQVSSTITSITIFGTTQVSGDLNEINVPGTVTTIPANTLNDGAMAQLTTKLTFNQGTTTINGTSFINMQNLQELDMENSSITSINLGSLSFMFFNLKSLKILKLPKNLLSITVGYGIFTELNSLKTLNLGKLQTILGISASFTNLFVCESIQFDNLQSLPTPSSTPNLFTNANSLSKFIIPDGQVLATNFRIFGGFMTRTSTLDIFNKAAALPTGVSQTIYIQTRIYNLLDANDIAIIVGKGYSVSSY